MKRATTMQQQGAPCCLGVTALLALALLAASCAVSSAASEAGQATQPQQLGRASAASSVDPDVVDGVADGVSAPDKRGETEQSEQASRPSRVPVPVYLDYNVSTSIDTFEICDAQSGMDQQLSLQGLAELFGIPGSVVDERAVSLARLRQLMLLSAVAAPWPHSSGKTAADGNGTAPPPSRAVVPARLDLLPALTQPNSSSGLTPGGLPRRLHFTFANKDALKPFQAIAMVAWAVLNPGYTMMLWDDADIDAFMRTHYPQHLQMFQGFKSPVERTDLWRYLVLCVYGGVYADSDVVPAKPVDNWVTDAGLLVGVENAFPTLEDALDRTYTRQVQMVQWVIASRPGHPVVCRMGDYVSAHVRAEQAGNVSNPDRDHAILERTGPGIWSSSVHDFMAANNATMDDAVAGALVADMRLLPQSVFGCATATFNFQDPFPYVYHMFKGSWRKTPGPLMRFLRLVVGKVFGYPDDEDEEDYEDDESANDEQAGNYNATRPVDPANLKLLQMLYAGIESGEPGGVLLEQGVQGGEAAESRQLQAGELGSSGGESVGWEHALPAASGALAVDVAAVHGLRAVALLVLLAVTVCMTAFCTNRRSSGLLWRSRSGTINGASSAVLVGHALLVKGGDATGSSRASSRSPSPRRKQRAGSWWEQVQSLMQPKHAWSGEQLKDASL